MRSCGRLLLALVATLLPAGAGASGPTIRIATEGAYPPFNYVEKDEPAGFEVDLGRALCAAMEASCTFVLQDWEGMVSGLKEGRYDAVMSSLEITPERRRRVAFTRRYYRIPAALIGPAGGAPLVPGSEPTLAGKSVGAVADSEFASYLDSVPGVEVRTFGKLDEANLDLLTGRLDFVLGDRLAIETFLASREGSRCCRFVAELPVDRGEGFGVAVRPRDGELLARFDAAIVRVGADGTFDRVRAKYFTFDIR